MKKTKRTLLISSLIMALTLVVTIVSVSAAWFSNSTSSKNDGFVIDSDTIQEFASLDVNTDITAQEGGASLWPAKATPGWLLNNSGVAMNAPTGKQLRQATSTSVLPSGVSEWAKCANSYFPISFVGASDPGFADGFKSLMLTFNSASIAKYTHKEGDQTIVDINFVDEFIVEMSIVKVTKSEEVDANGDTVAKYDIEDYDLTDFNLANMQSGQVYYEQPLDEGNPGNDFYLLIEPNTEYYVRATVYFNKVDEEVNPELLYTTITLNFSMTILNARADVFKVGA